MFYFFFVHVSMHLRTLLPAKTLVGFKRAAGNTPRRCNYFYAHKKKMKTIFSYERIIYWRVNVNNIIMTLWPTNRE